MQIRAILKARTLAMLELDQLNQGGRIRLSDCVKPIVARYDFSSYPDKLEDFNLENGIRFGDGKYDQYAIDSLVIHGQAIYVDTFADSEVSRNVILDLLSWGNTELGLTFVPSAIRQWANLSQIVFSTEFPLLQALSPSLTKLAQKTSEFTKQTFSGLAYQPSLVVAGHDPMRRNGNVASFTISHRANSYFEDNIFFSEAPLPTGLHIEMLAELEADVMPK